MEKRKLIETRKARGGSQSQLAGRLCMDVSNYSRRERGQAKINIAEWEKLAKILDVPLCDIYEPDESPAFICKDNASDNDRGADNIGLVAGSLLQTQQKYIRKLEEENARLAALLEEKTPDETAGEAPTLHSP